ncbi:MAG: hypothetical protein OEN21_17860, partial [Myxococcales bacterium]|nr:hypothetical protein [Myxococcales bacterium]
MAFADEERDLEQTAGALKAWFAPKLSVPAEDIRIEDLDSPLSTGFSSDTLLFDLVYPNDDLELREGLVAR